MLLGFKPRFEPFVLDGSKTHTIRAKRKNRPRVGEVCHCYGDTRQKTMHLLGRWPCVKVQQISIAFRRVETHDERYARDVTIRVDGQMLDYDEACLLDWRDGFRGLGPAGALEEMLRWWSFTHGKGKEFVRFVGDLIHWDYERPLYRLNGHYGMLKP